MAQATRNAYGQELAKLVQERQDIVVLDADLSGSTKTAEARKVAPERHINAGIAEANMMGMAAGLAASGKTVFASSFAVFAAGRAFEIIRNSICYPCLNVKICATHAGLSVGEDGASHQSVEDIAIMRSLPNMQVFSPADQYATKAVIDYVASVQGPCYVRLGRSNVEDVYDETETIDVTKVNCLRSGEDILLCATGLMTAEALKAANILAEKGITAEVLDICCLKPLDREGLLRKLRKHKLIFSCEEASIIGGLFGALAEVAVQEKLGPIYPVGVNDCFGESGKDKDVLKKYGISAEHIVEVVMQHYLK